MESLYCITAVRVVNGAARQVPTFFLDAGVQGIVSTDHAKRIAADILGPGEVVIHADPV